MGIENGVARQVDQKVGDIHAHQVHRPSLASDG